MDLSVQASGIFALGVVIGYAVWFWLVRVASPTAATVTEAIALLVGGVAIKFVADNSKSVKDGDIWWYAIGLLCGLFLFMLARVLKDGWVGLPASLGFSRQVD